MVTRKTRTTSGRSQPAAKKPARQPAVGSAKGNGARKSAPARRTAAARKRPGAAPPAAGKPPATRRPSGAPKKAAAAARRGAVAGGAKAARATTTRPPAPGAARNSRAAVEARQRLETLQQEKTLLQEQLANARSELDSALAEAARLRERTAALEAEPGRAGGREREAAGPSGYDNGAELEDELPASAEDDLEGAAGFFDRMDEIRARRNELDRERSDREMEQSEQSFWMVCPKCGDTMEEQESENVKLERCETCGGLYLDRGEVDLLLALTTGPDGPRRLHNMLKF